MSDYLTHLVQRSLNLTPAIQPRLASLFEPHPVSERADFDDALLEEDDVVAVQAPEQAVPPPSPAPPALPERAEEHASPQPLEAPHRTEKPSEHVPTHARPMQPLRPPAPSPVHVEAIDHTPPSLPHVQRQQDEATPVPPARVAQEPATPAAARPVVTEQVVERVVQREVEMAVPVSVRLPLVAPSTPAPERIAPRPPSPSPQRRATARRRPTVEVPLDQPLSVEQTYMVEAPPVQMAAPSAPPSSIAPLVAPEPRATRMPAVAAPQITRYVEAPPTPRAEPAPAPAPTIQVTIGRVEVRATPPSASPTKSKPASPAMSLEEYLRQRSRGGAR